MKSFKVLYDTVVEKKYVGELSDSILRQALKLASLNKVLLQFLRDLGLKGSLRDKEEGRFRSFIRSVNEISNSLRGLNYVFFKILKPAAYVPSDIDLLIDPTHMITALLRLEGLGYRIKVVEPYCVTVSSTGSLVDLYLHPTLGGMIYLDGGKLLHFRREIYFNGVRIPVLKEYVEALVSAVHALFKERIYTLSDYLVLTEMSSKETLELAREHNCLKSLLLAFKLNDEVKKGSLPLPYKVPMSLWIAYVGYKIAKDPIARSSSLNIIKALKDHRIGRLALSKITRKSY